MEGSKYMMIDQSSCFLVGVIDNVCVIILYPEADMRYYADAAGAVCVKNIRLCVKFMLEFMRLTRNVTIWEKSGT